MLLNLTRIVQKSFGQGFSSNFDFNPLIANVALIEKPFNWFLYDGNAGN